MRRLGVTERADVDLLLAFTGGLVDAQLARTAPEGITVTSAWTPDPARPRSTATPRCGWPRPSTNGSWRLFDGLVRASLEDGRHAGDERHGRPFTLHLTGPAGGTWGSGGPELEFDAVEFCRAISGRGSAPLDTEVPF